MQNNVIRYLLNAPTRTHIGRDAFKRVGLLPVHVRVEQLKLNHMFNVINGSAPKYLHTHIEMVHTQHNHNTRASVRSCKLPRVNNAARSAFFYTGIILWNNLPLSLKILNTRGIFRHQVKSFLWNRVKELF